MWYRELLLFKLHFQFSLEGRFSSSLLLLLFLFLAIFTTTSICLERFVRYIERLQRVVVLISHGSNADCSKLVPFSLDKVKRALSCGTEKCVDSTGALTWVRPPVPKLCRARVMAVRPDPRPALKPDGTVIGRP